jgi:hypothetical protein
MIVTYTSEDGSKHEWEFKPDRLLTTEAEAIERVTGMTYAEFGEKLMNGGMTARRAMVWVLRKRNGEPTLKFREVDFPVGDVDIELDEQEKDKVRRAVLADTSMTDAQRAYALAELGAGEDDGDQAGGESGPKDDLTSPPDAGG